MNTCTYCDKECKNGNSLRNHERLCKSNPNRQIPNLDAARQATFKKYPCSYCKNSYRKNDIKRHEASCAENPDNQKECPVCKEMFSGSGVTCSYSCSNKHFRTGEGNGNWKGLYRSVAKLHHGMVCVVCGEDKIVAVHHYDENHNNNDPNNLIPLCPTHHQYVHSKYKNLVMEEINKYRNNRGIA